MAIPSPTSPKPPSATERSSPRTTAALRSRFSGLPTKELVSRSVELRIAAGREARAERQLRTLQERIERAKQGSERHDWERKRAQELKRRFRKDELPRIDRDEAGSLQRLAELEGEAGRFQVPSGSARRELAVADRVLAERRELAISAARIAPPAYIRNELGVRPSELTKRRAWDRGVAEIVTYRQHHGVKDHYRAFGPESRHATEHARHERTRPRLLHTQRMLGLRHHREQARSLRRLGHRRPKLLHFY